MRIKGLFWMLTILLLSLMALVSYFAFYSSSHILFISVELLILFIALYLLYFYRRIVKPLYIIGNGMDLLKEQDFSSRLRLVGQADADRIVDVFNKMMEQLKNERIHIREQNHFLDLLINASPLGVIILNLDREIVSLNPSARKILTLSETDKVEGKKLSELDSILACELENIEINNPQTIRLNNSNIYKCTQSSFIDNGFQHPFFLIESLTQEVFKAEKKAYEKVIRMIAHEVNNTTAGITSTLDSLENTFREMENCEDICEIMRISIERCYSLSKFITNFADVVKIPDPLLKTHNLNQLLESGKRFMENICNNRQIELITEFTEAPLLVRADSVLIEQVVLNINKNAAESIEYNGKIYIRTFAGPNGLEIADTGKGINKETESRLFTPFFSTKPNGQGLGLIFIREVLHKHNCTFSLLTTDDGLTRFRIIFP